jgi:hypothetical protein
MSISTAYVPPLGTGPGRTHRIGASSSDTPAAPLAAAAAAHALPAELDTPSYYLALAVAALVRREQFDGTDPHRRELYLIPPRGSAVYLAQQQPSPPDIRRVRLLRSRSTQGLIICAARINGVDLLTDWGSIPDLLFLDVLRYFVDHPEINAIWIENVDSSEYSASHASSDFASIGTDQPAHPVVATDARTASSATASDAPTRYARVVSRADLTYEYVAAIRTYQHRFFLDRGVCPPTAVEFLATLHGR